MYHGKLYRVYHTYNGKTECAVYSQKKSWKFIVHGIYDSKPIKIAYVDRPFPNVINEDEIDFGLEMVGFTDWESYIHANPCLGHAVKENGVVVKYE